MSILCTVARRTAHYVDMPNFNGGSARVDVSVTPCQPAVESRCPVGRDFARRIEPTPDERTLQRRVRRSNAPRAGRALNAIAQLRK